MILAEELAQQRKRFRHRLSDLVAEFSRTGNRFGSALQHRLHTEAEEELRSRGSALSSTYRRVLQVNGAGLRDERLAAALEQLRSQLADEYQDINRALGEVSFGQASGAPPLTDTFLEQILQRHIAELSMPSDGTKSNETVRRGGIVEIKPGLWGVSLDIKEIWRRLKTWWAGRRSGPGGGL